RKIFKVDDHIGVAIAGLTADGRVLSRYMRSECINYSFTYESPLPVGRLVVQLADKAQVRGVVGFVVRYVRVFCFYTELSPGQRRKEVAVNLQETEEQSLRKLVRMLKEKKELRWRVKKLRKHHGSQESGLGMLWGY
ncbi:unnamed protein product, partial [Linum tenue]